MDLSSFSGARGVYGDMTSCTIKGAQTYFDVTTALQIDNVSATVNINAGKFKVETFTYLKKSQGSVINIDESARFAILSPYNIASVRDMAFDEEEMNGIKYYKISATGKSAYECIYSITDNSTPKAAIPYKTFGDAVDAGKTAIIMITPATKSCILSGKNITLYQKEDKSYQGTITNQGTLSFNSNSCALGVVWDNITIDNQGTLKLNTELYYDDKFIIKNQEGKTVEISNGYFKNSLLQTHPEYKNYLKTNYTFVDLGNGYSWAVDGTKKVATVGDENYPTLQSALNASSESAYAKLVSSVAKNNTISAITINNGKKAFLDLNGKTLTITGLGGVYSSISNGSLTITNSQTTGGITCSGANVFDMKGSTDPTAAEYSVLTIDKSVKVTQENGNYFAFVNSPLDKNNNDLDNKYGIVVNFNGTYNGTVPFSIHGALLKRENNDNAPKFNIGADANITATAIAYAAGYGIWEYAGTAITNLFGIEMRAGEFTMTGGKIECTMAAPADDEGNGSGSTSQACAISAMQHNTKLPISITINGGELKAYTPIYQANPQGNSDEDIKKVSVVVNNPENGAAPKIYSNSNNIVWSANKEVTLNGGVYNLNPSAYVASDKAVVENTDETTKATYPYAIGNKADAMTTIKEGNWDVADTWKDGKVPTGATPVVIAHNVIIPANTKAEACGVEVQSNSVITVEGALVIGNNGIKGITNANQLLIKDGGAMVISPVATQEYSQPLATVELKTVIRDVKDEYAAGDRSYEYIWQNIGLPVTSMTITPAKTLTVNTWDIMSAWVPATEFGTAFRGYHITNLTNQTAGMLYTFAGQLVGTQNATLSMPRDGFHFFGNSWMAPFDVEEILNQLNSKNTSDDVNSTVYVYIFDQKAVDGITYNDGQYVDINLNNLKNANFAATFGQIAALQGFFLHSDAKAEISLNYEKAVWNAMLAKPVKATKRLVEEEDGTAARLIFTAENGRADVVYLYEGEAFTAPKMMNVKPNVNIYAITADGNYSTIGLDKIEGTQIGIQTNAKTHYTISFDWLKGETLYLKDKKENKYIAMTETATYEFMADANTTIDDRFEIVGKSDVPTMIEVVENNAVATGIYTIMGQYVGETSMWNTLPAGMYIVDGQKRVK